jgi:hypothetical protein
VIFESVHNYHERAIFRLIREQAPLFPGLAADPGFLADVACVALNRLAPRYVRNNVDMAFYMDDSELANQQAGVKSAVDYAFAFVQSRIALDDSR